MRFNLKIYGQACQHCGVFGSGLVIKTPLNHLLKLYRNIILRVYNESEDLTQGIELSRVERYGLLPNYQRFDNNGITSHMTELCEACAEGVCFSFFQVHRWRNRKEAERARAREG